METGIQAIQKRASDTSMAAVGLFGRQTAEAVRRFHRGIPGYQPTPLLSLDRLAAALGVRRILVKDESPRFGLKAFKVLGGSYCVGSVLAEKLGRRIESLRYAALLEPEVRKQLGELTFVTATDGNHGKGIAWAAGRLGHRSVVYLPKGSAKERLCAIRDLGATAEITKYTYDDSVRLAQRAAAENGWILVQDTAWPGYERLPRKIMQGYTTMALEAVEQLGEKRPSHIFLQAGVGALAGALTGFFRDFYRDGPGPVIVIVEPEAANCLFRTAKDGSLQKVEGELDTMMAGLACGEPCTLAWEILKDHADYFVSIPDRIAAQGMRILAKPLDGDPKIISGESGAAGLGLAVEILREPALRWLRQQLELDDHSEILCFSTEGATDREMYQKIVGESAGQF